MDTTTFRTPTGWFAQSGDLRIGEFATAEEATAALTLALAAPELLAALQTALNIMAGVAIGDLKRIRRDSPAIIAARAAIRKAQGVQP